MITHGPHPHVWLRLPSGPRVCLEPGDLVGRHWSAALVLDDPRISEAHATISLRDGALWMLSLRRLVAVGGKPVADVRLAEGTVVELAPGVEVAVESVVLPTEVLMISGEGLPTAILPSVCSILGQPRPSLLARHDPHAAALLWSTGVGWRVRIGDDVGDLVLDHRYEAGGVAFVVRAHAPHGAERTHTPGGVHAPVRLVAAFDTVQIHRDGQPVAVIGGLPARILSELVALGGPAHWTTLARELWPHERDDAALRKRFDVAMVRTRSKLREIAVRSDLIHADGSGRFELVLRQGDEAEDRT